jgi:ribosomal protein S18 acetylase RimI-like enzyme
MAHARDRCLVSWSPSGPAPPRTAARPAGVIRRPETAADAGFLFALFCVSRPPGADFAGLDAAMRDTLLRQQYAGQTATYRARYPQALFDIVHCDDAPIGRIVFDRGVAAFTLVDIALLPAWRGRGIGMALIAALCGAAREAGRPVRLSVSLGNPDARRLYQRLGFVVIAGSGTDVQLEWRPSGASS